MYYYYYIYNLPRCCPSPPLRSIDPLSSPRTTADYSKKIKSHAASIIMLYNVDSTGLSFILFSWSINHIVRRSTIIFIIHLFGTYTIAFFFFFFVFLVYYYAVCIYYYYYFFHLLLFINPSIIHYFQYILISIDDVILVIVVRIIITFLVTIIYYYQSRR